MSNISIGSVTGGTNNIGDDGTINIGYYGAVNNHPAAAGHAQASSLPGQPAPQAPSTARPGNLGVHAYLSSDPADALQADQLQQSLETAGIQVWRDTHNLTPGQDRHAAIRQAITTGTLAFIACFSRTGISRNRSNQRQELSLATEELRRRDPARPWLIPVRFDDCAIPDLDIGGGRALASIHTIDLFGPRSARNLEKLVTAVQEILG